MLNCSPDNRDRRVAGGHDSSYPDRAAEREQRLVRHLAWQSLAVQPAAPAEEGVAGVDDLAHLAQGLGVRLADLAGDQSGQGLGVRLDRRPAASGNATIAAQLYLSEGAISKYTTTIFAKLGGSQTWLPQGQGGQCGVHDGTGIQVVCPVQVGDGTGLAETVHAEADRRDAKSRT